MRFNLELLLYFKIVENKLLFDRSRSLVGDIKLFNDRDNNELSFLFPNNSFSKLLVLIFLAFGSIGFDYLNSFDMIDCSLLMLERWSDYFLLANKSGIMFLYYYSPLKFCIYRNIYYDFYRFILLLQAVLFAFD